MKVKQSTLTIAKLLSQFHQINLNPQWQRGPVWSVERRSLLIDSILRNMDIPKIYLLRCPKGAAHTYEAVDGQQRLRALSDYAHDAFPLSYEYPLRPINGIEVDGRIYSKLDKKLAARFSNFRISISEVISATHDEVRQLFLRLQMGVSLNPAELRNAMAGPLRNIVDAIALSHRFFVESTISQNRYKRQDYLAHAFAMAAHNGVTDLKAPNLRSLYEEFTAAQTDSVLDLMSSVGEALDLLAVINELAGKKIKQKWVFVDLFWLILNALQQGKAINPEVLASTYLAFEGRRRKFTSTPEGLLRKNRQDPERWDKWLYAYIQAFKTSGADRKNLKIRHDALMRIFGL